jgi:hypothetical protein
MTVNEVLDDLSERLERAEARLLAAAARRPLAPSELIRLTSKAEGLALARDYLRSYRP